MIKNIKIERMLAREGDALLESKKARILAGCGAENEAKITRPVVSARARIARTLAVAAAVALLAVGMIAALPLMLAEGEVPPEISDTELDNTVLPETGSDATTESEEVTEYYYLDDLKKYEMQVMLSRSTYISMPPADSYEEPLSEETVKAMFGAEELPFPLWYDDIDELNLIATEAYYSPSGDVYSVMVVFLSEDGWRIHVCIDPNKIPDYTLWTHMNPTDDTLLSEKNSTVINGYTVGIRTFPLGSMDIGMEKGGMGIWFGGDDKQALEIICNFILNSEINLEVLKKNTN